jgi:hypothetical protein
MKFFVTYNLFLYYDKTAQNYGNAVQDYDRAFRMASIFNAQKTFHC